MSLYWRRLRWPLGCFGVVAIVGSALAQGSVSAKNYFESKQLVGTYAVNCAAPPSPLNPYQVFRTSDADAIQYDFMTSNETRQSVWLFDNVTEVSRDTFTVIASQVQETPGQSTSRRRMTYRFDPGRLRNLDSINENGTISSRDGRSFPSGRPTPWAVKCEPGVPRTILGARLSWTTADTSLRYDLGDYEGALVQEVFENTPAQSAGLQFGDIIVAYNGEPLSSSSDLTSRVAVATPGDKITLTVARASQRKEIDFIAAPRSPDLRFPSVTESAEAHDLLGRFAVACNAKISKENTLVTIGSNQTGGIALDIRDGPAHVSQSFLVQEIYAQYPAETRLDLTYGTVRGRWIIRIASGKFRVIEIVYGPKYAVRDGRDISTGRELQWLQKCR